MALESIIYIKFDKNLIIITGYNKPHVRKDNTWQIKYYSRSSSEKKCHDQGMWKPHLCSISKTIKNNTSNYCKPN